MDPTIKVCDALCGSGKTSACIEMMNRRTDVKFVFVTQFLSEVERIKQSCRARGFVSPDNDIETGKTKLADIKNLFREGKNIATTHSLFVNYTEEIKQIIRDQKYVLILDETVDILRMSNLKMCDMNLLARSNIISEEEGRIKWIDDTYEKEDFDGEGKFSKEVLLSKSKNLLRYDDEYFFWALPPELFSCFYGVYVLTYLFHAQLLRCFFDMYDLKYEYIGTRFEDGKYVFCDAAEMDRKRDLRDKIHILEHRKLNSVGDRRSDLSATCYMFNKHREGAGLTERLRKNLVNVFRNIFKGSSDEIMWTTFKDYREALSSKRIKSRFVPFNHRASNQYANRRYLAYCVNNFMRPWEAKFLRDHGVEVDQDTYALSILVQWIFRSAIRNGEEIWLYVPSVRMRSLLKQWIDNLAEGRDLEPVRYVTSRSKKASKKGGGGGGEEV